MALHEDTEIYRSVADLQRKVMRAVADMRRDVKNIYGAELAFESHQMGVLVRQANIARGAGKVPILEVLLDRTEYVTSILRTLRDERMLPLTRYSDAMPIVVSIGKQATGWKNHYAPAPPPAA